MYFKILIFKFMSELFECRRCKYKSIKYPYKANNSNNKLFVWRDLNDKDSFKKVIKSKIKANKELTKEEN